MKINQLNQLKRYLNLLIVLFFAINTWGQHQPYQTPELSSETRAKDLKTFKVNIL